MCVLGPYKWEVNKRFASCALKFHSLLPPSHSFQCSIFSLVSFPSFSSRQQYPRRTATAKIFHPSLQLIAAQVLEATSGLTTEQSTAYSTTTALLVVSTDAATHTGVLHDAFFLHVPNLMNLCSAWKMSSPRRMKIPSTRPSSYRRRYLCRKSNNSSRWRTGTRRRLKESMSSSSSSSKYNNLHRRHHHRCRSCNSSSSVLRCRHLFQMHYHQCGNESPYKHNNPCKKQNILVSYLS